MKRKNYIIFFIIFILIFSCGKNKAKEEKEKNDVNIARENEKLDERERDALAASGRMAFLVGGIICVPIIALEWKFRGRMPTEIWAVYASMYGTNELIQYFRLRKISHLIFALLQLAMAVFFFGMFFMSLVR